MILIRIDIASLSAVLKNREDVPEDLHPVLDRLICAYQRKLEESAKEFATGKGDFETCLFEAL